MLGAFSYPLYAYNYAHLIHVLTCDYLIRHAQVVYIIVAHKFLTSVRHSHVTLQLTYTMILHNIASTHS